MRPVSRLPEFRCDQVAISLGRYIFSLKNAKYCHRKSQSNSIVLTTSERKLPQCSGYEFKACDLRYCYCRSLKPMNMGKELNKMLENFESQNVLSLFHVTKGLKSWPCSSSIFSYQTSSTETEPFPSFCSHTAQGTNENLDRHRRLWPTLLRQSLVL
jgi:hypothetical protein